MFQNKPKSIFISIFVVFLREASSWMCLSVLTCFGVTVLTNLWEPLNLRVNNRCPGKIDCCCRFVLFFLMYITLLQKPEMMYDGNCCMQTHSGIKEDNRTWDVDVTNEGMEMNGRAALWWTSQFFGGLRRHVSHVFLLLQALKGLHDIKLPLFYLLHCRQPLLKHSSQIYSFINTLGLCIESLF